MIYILFFLYVISLVFISLLNNSTTVKMSAGLFFFISFIFIIAIVVRPGYMPDYNAYYSFFSGESTSGRFEPSAKLIKIISPGFHFFLFIFALISFGLKILTIKRCSSSQLLSLVTLLSTTFVLHDMIQIRASCAIAIFLWSLQYLSERKYLKYFSCIGIACLFHYSSAIYFFIPLFSKDKISRKFWILLFIVSYGLYFIHIDLIDIAKKIIPSGTYLLGTLQYFSGQRVNIFNAGQMLKLLIFLIFIYKAKKLNRYQIICLKILGLSVIFVPLLASIAVLAFRISELLYPVIIFLLPEFINIFKSKTYSMLGFIILIVMLFFINNIYPGYLF